MLRMYVYIYIHIHTYLLARVLPSSTSEERLRFKSWRDQIPQAVASKLAHSFSRSEQGPCGFEV